MTEEKKLCSCRKVEPHHATELPSGDWVMVLFTSTSENDFEAEIRHSVGYNDNRIVQIAHSTLEILQITAPLSGAKMTKVEE